MLNKILVSAIALAAIVTPAEPRAQEAPAAAAAVPVTDVDPALWVVKDEDTTIYLFGTVHVLKPGLGWFDDGVKAAFDKSNEVVLEIVDPDPAKMQSLILSTAVSMSGPGLSEKLPADKRAAFAKVAGEAAASMGAPAAAFERFEPWFAALTLSMAPLPKLGWDPNSGAEKVITAAAKATNKPISGLETVEQQLGYFDTVPEPLQIKYLVTTIDDYDQIGPMLDKMVVQWGKGDADGLATTMNEGMAKSPELAKILLAERNERWAGWIQQRLAKPGTVFVAVGAGHLAGSESVQAKLAAHKLKATRVAY